MKAKAIATVITFPLVRIKTILQAGQQAGPRSERRGGETAGSGPESPDSEGLEFADRPRDIQLGYLIYGMSFEGASVCEWEPPRAQWEPIRADTQAAMPCSQLMIFTIQLSRESNQLKVSSSKVDSAHIHIFIARVCAPPGFERLQELSLEEMSAVYGQSRY